MYLGIAIGEWTKQSKIPQRGKESALGKFTGHSLRSIGEQLEEAIHVVGGGIILRENKFLVLPLIQKSQSLDTPLIANHALRARIRSICSYY